MNSTLHVGASCGTVDKIKQMEEQLAAHVADYDECLTTIWVLLASFLIFFMNAGFSMQEAGSLRYKNTQYVLAKNLLIVVFSFLSWYALGYAIAFGVTDDPSQFAGGTHFFMQGFWDHKQLLKKWFFHATYCSTSVTIVGGAMAERTNLVGFVIFTAFYCGVIYPTVVYWGWSGAGLLNYSSDGVATSWTGPPLIDYSGSGIVHMAGGVAGLVGAVVVGPRQDRWARDYAWQFSNYSIPFLVLGTFFLWFGWYGFSPGHSVTMHSATSAHTTGLVACNFTLAPSAAGLLVLILRATVIEPRRVDAEGFCNGILSGLVAITGGAAVFRPSEAVITGIISGLVYVGSQRLLEMLRVDDVVSGISIHGFCGLLGLLVAGLLGNPGDNFGGNGMLYGGSQLGTQLFSSIIICLWVGLLSAAVFIPLKRLGLLRYCPDDEMMQKAAAHLDAERARNSFERNSLDTRDSFES